MSETNTTAKRQKVNPSPTPKYALRLKLDRFYEQALADGRITSIKDLERRTKISYVTIHKWVNAPAELESINLLNLSAFLEALGFSKEQIGDLKLRDLFELVPYDIDGSKAYQQQAAYAESLMPKPINASEED